MDLKILKNPIAIGIFCFVITFIYFYYDNERKNKKNPNIKKKYDWVTPSLFGVFSWFIAANYFEAPIENLIENNNITIPELPKATRIIDQDGINIPTNIDAKMPDMFIELDNFS